ncbi:Zn(2)-C6 fungal-type domain-containing protein [Madurella fahalii]|uniref:Zn(2)-C6 fungal-type domain-containing protein n=1 Tax=Madurella fahalii TaxID=1157608 RepID=A0ABQ0GMJ2_9PEZI
MEALLGASQSNPSCDSIADLQDKLRDLFSKRVSETRAEHISVTFELRSTTIFEIPVTETENEALENASNIDPLLGGTRSIAAPPAVVNGRQATRRINAIDALVNQPLDDPVLQTSITRHIISGLDEVDGSDWTVRQVSRAQQGWTFTYICKDSWQSWSRRSTKTPAKVLVGEWSEKGGQDPVHMARPAFDCRGSVKIAFVKSTRTIDVKYEHMPMHKTVAQLIELLAPPPAAPPVKTPAKKPKEPKPLKERKTPKEPKSKTPKKRAGENRTADGEGSQSKRRRKKKDSAAPTGPEGSALPPEMPGALPVGHATPRQLYNTQVESTGGAPPDGSSNYPEGLVSANAADAAATDDDVHSHSILNLPPGEAARRRDLAIKLLTESNIDPKTLSAEQFSIFANQSPELQQDSLAMLVKYGAERLRIVHPDKDEASSGQATPDGQSTPGSAMPATETPKSNKPKKQPDAEASPMPEAGHAPQNVEAAGRKRKTPSQRICDNCRVVNFRGKCDKKNPSCSSCVLEGLQCVYSAAKPKQSKAPPAEQEAPGQSAATAVPDEEPEDLGAPGFHTVAVGGPVHEPIHEQVNETVNEPISDPVHHETASPSNTLAQSHGIYQHSSRLTFPQVGATTTSEPPQSSTPSAPMGYISHSLSETPENSLHGYTYSTQADRAAPEYTEKTTIAVEQVQRGKSVPQPASRRSLPTSQSSHLTATTDTTMNAQSSWQSMSGQPTMAVSATRTSPRQSRMKKPALGSQGYGDLQQRVSSWVTANQPTPETTQPMRTSPSQAAAPPGRSKSRQSRVQNHTTVHSIPAARPGQSQGTQPLADNSGYESAATAQQPTSTDGYNSYNQYPSAASTQPDSSSDRITYQPYTNNQASTSSNSYSSFDNYNICLANPASSTMPTPAPQTVASSYPSTSVAGTNTTQWGGAASTSQARNPRIYNATQATAGTSSSHNMSSNPEQSQLSQGFNAHPQLSTQARGSSSVYAQQQQKQPQQPHQPQQTQQQQRRQQQQQQQNYSGYMTQQPHTAAISTSHRGWYAFAANNAAAPGGYNPNAAVAGSASHGQDHGHGHGHATNHAAAHGHGGGGGSHRSMNLSSHAYSSMGGDEQAMYDLLRSGNPVG